jgi:hypothetical protein
MYPTHTYRDRLGVDLIFRALPFGALRYIKPGDAVSYANFCRSRDAAIRSYDELGELIQTGTHTPAIFKD